MPFGKMSIGRHWHLWAWKHNPWPPENGGIIAFIIYWQVHILMKGCRSMIYWFIHRVITPINGLINQWVSLFFLNLLIGAQELHVYLVFGLYTNISNQNPPVLTIISSSFAGLPISVFLPTQGVLPAAGRHWAKRNQETFHHPRSGERFANKQGMLSRAKPYRIPSMGIVYLPDMKGWFCMLFLPTWKVDFYGFHVGKYTSPMDARSDTSYFVGEISQLT